MLLKANRLFLFSYLILYSVFSACNDVDKNSEEELNTLIDNWHHSAAVADEDAFFGFMTDDCIYIGTDISEKWKRDELRKWSEKYFDRESAWSFNPYEREIYFNGNNAWFDEKLETWMGECRGSGVLTKTDQGWKLKHYHLSVTIPNEKIQDFINLNEEN